MAYTQIDTTSNKEVVPMNVSNSPTVFANHQSYGTYYPESSTVLTSGQTFTGSAHDGGSSNNNYNRLRVVVASTAGNGHGHLIVEQSTDGVTFRETNRNAVPSDGQYYTFDLAWNMRYIRVKFLNGSVTQTAFFLQSYGVRVDGSTDSHISPTFIHSTTALAASATFTGVTLDTGAANGYDNHRALAYADQAGTLYLEQSRDNSTWRTTTTQAVSAGTAIVIQENIVSRYVRVRFVNGATAQANFELQSTLVHL